MCGCGRPASRSARAVSSLSWATTSASGRIPHVHAAGREPLELAGAALDAVEPLPHVEPAPARRPPARGTSAPCAGRAARSRDPRRAPRRRAPRSSRCADGRRRRTSCRNRAARAGSGWALSGEAVVSDSLPGRSGVCRLRHRLQPVADAVARLDERVGRRLAVDLLAQAAHEDVHGPVAMRLAPAPELLQQLVAGDDAAAIERELVEEAELRRRQLGARGRRRRPAPRAGRSAAPRSRSARRAASPRGASPAATPRARAPRAPSSRTASRGSRRPRSRARARGRARCRGRRRRRSACRFPRSGPSRSASSRRRREASGRARRRPASRSGAAPAPACRCRPRRGRSRRRRDAAPSPARSPRRPRR